MKNSMATGLLALLLPVCICQLRAQQSGKDLTSQFEKGDISEIKDKRRVFVIADWPVPRDRMRDHIIKALQKYPSVQVVNDPADAEYVITYRIESEKYRVHINDGMSPPQDMMTFGRMLVYIPQESGKHRLVWETRRRYPLPHRWDGRPVWEQPLEKSMIGTFIKALKKARGEK